jgi:hypothetical protein
MGDAVFRLHLQFADVYKNTVKNGCWMIRQENGCGNCFIISRAAFFFAGIKGK